MDLYVRITGVWVPVLGGDLSVRQGGAWVGVKSGRVRVSGTWEQFYAEEADYSTTMTRGTDGAKVPATGYQIAGGFGSLANQGFFHGIQCTEIVTSSDALSVSLAGTWAQDRFTSFTCSLGTFDSADADSFDTSGGESSWVWLSAGTLPESGTETVTLRG